MEVGVVLPRTGIGSDVEALSEYVTGVESAGYRFLIAYDHVLGADPTAVADGYDRSNPIHEPFVLFGYLARATDRLTLVTGILILPQRQTALVAKQAATVDVLSDGRLRLGVGIGWNDVEYDALGVDFRTRGRRIEEQLDVLRHLWTDELVTYEGEFHHIPTAGINPRPIQRPIPVWMGGDAPPVLERTGRLASGWLPRAEPPARAAEKLGTIRSSALEAGRNPDDLAIVARMPIPADDRDSWLDTARAWRDIGCTHLAVNTMRAGYTTPAEHLDAVRDFADRACDAGFDIGR